MRVLLLLGLLGLQSPDRWDTVVQEAFRLRSEAKLAEAAALLEKALAEAPRGDGHLLLGVVYEELAAAASVAVPPDQAAQRARLTQAVEQFARALDLIEPRMRFFALTRLVNLHRRSGLDRPAEAARFAARLVDEFPNRAEVHVLHGRVLDEQRRLEDPVSAGEPMALVDVPVGPTVTSVGDALEQALLDAEARATGEWDKGRYDQAVQILADFADAHPEYARARMSLGYRYTDRAALEGPSTTSPARRQGYFRLAAAAFERALAVSQPLEVMYAVEHLVAVYAPDALNEPDRAIAATREGILKAPAHPRTRGLLIRALLDAGREDELTAAFDAARTAIPRDERVTLANEYLALVGTAAQSRAANAHLVQVSETLIDAALARDPDELFALATKEWALRERAARVEQDAARAAALVQEADRIAARVKVLRSRTP